MSAPGQRTVTGTFRSKEALVEAIASLSRHSVPDDAIEVMLIDREGLHPRTVSARPAIGWWKGMRAGLISGGVIGAACFALIASGVLPDLGIAQMLPESILSATFVGALVGAGTIGPAMALLMLGRGRRRVHVSADEAEREVVAVTIQGDQIVDIAREVLLHSGAERVSG